MVMQSMREGAAGGVLKFFLFGILVLAVGGLVLMDVGGFFRGGVSQGDVAKVGKEDISVVSFDRTVRRALVRVGISPQEALKLGYMNEVLGAEIRNSLMHQAANDLGVRIGREQVATQISRMIEPMVQEGQPPQAVLNQVLQNQGMNEREFIRMLAREMAGGVLAQAIQSGAAGVPENIVRDMYLHNNEERDIELLVFPLSKVKDVKEPAEEQLSAMYESVKENYATPETRQVTLAFVRDDKLKNTMDISEEEVRAAYDDSIEAFSTPEERSIEQSIVKSEDEAQAILEATQKGTDLKKAVEEATGSADAYLGEAKFQEKGLLEEVGELVFAVEKENEIVGPVKTPLGWHVMKVKKIIPPQVKPFNEVKKELEDELKQVKLIDQLYETANIADDMLAGGASFEEVANEMGLEKSKLPPFNAYGQGKDGGDALDKYGDYRDIIIKTAYELFEGETSAVMEMQDGKFMAVHVESVTPKTYKPFEEVKDGIAKKWVEDQRALNNRMQTTAFLTMVESGKKSLEEIAKQEGLSVRKINNISRQGNPPAPLDQQSRNMIFEAPQGTPGLLFLEEGSAIAVISAINFPERDKIKEKDVAELQMNMERGNRNEALMMYMDAKREKYGVKVNPKILQTVYGSEGSAQ